MSSPCHQQTRIDTLEDDRPRLAALEAQMKDVVGNGQPGRLDRLEAKQETTSRTVHIGIGITVALQFAATVILGLMAAGAIKLR